MTVGTRLRPPRLPAIVDGVVSHHRPGPVRHAFRHRMYQWLVDLDRIPRQPWYLRPFGTFRAEDHLGEPSRSIRQNVEDFLTANDVVLGHDSRIVMLANARVLGHVFDPLTVYWCLDGSDDLTCVVAEVHNTYGERHAYLLRPNAAGSAYTDKQLYVSPFFDVSGHYNLRFDLTPERVLTTVTLRRNEQVAFTATFSGRPTPATPRRVAAHALRRPLMPQQVSALIRLHGLWLWLRRLPVRPRPQHRSQEGV
ncbi:MAG: DUF1365 domain-containing protein [Nocardioidaceae bacterium]